MKVRTASGKKHREPLEQRNIPDPTTPRVKKSYSVTKTNYLQLQLQASGKKRGNLERSLAGRQKRIAQLEREVREYQEVIVATGGQMRDLKGKYEQERMKGERAQSELKDAVLLCRDMKEKCQQLIERNQSLQASEAEWRAKAEAEQRKLRELKQLRKREKREVKELMMSLLGAVNQGKDSQELKRLSKLL